MAILPYLDTRGSFHSSLLLATRARHENPFNAKEVDESDLRSTAEVFSSSSKALESGIASRFASSGKYTTEQLEDGADLAELEKGGLQASGRGAHADEPDPDDKRSLYERLKAQKDAKQEEFEHNSAFKNQMDHWKMDEDEAAFEDARLLKMRQQEVEAMRLADESSQFYQLARAAQERTIAEPVRASTSGAAAVKRKAPPPKPTLKPAFKVLKAAPKGEGGTSTAATSGAAAAAKVTSAAASAAAPAASPAPSALPGAPPAPSAGGLPGMGAYDDSDDDDDDE